MRCGVGGRHSSDPALLWLWHKLAAVAPFQPLAQELPYAMGAALKKAEKKKRKKERKVTHKRIRKEETKLAQHCNSTTLQ